MIRKEAIEKRLKLEMIVSPKGWQEYEHIRCENHTNKELIIEISFDALLHPVIKIKRPFSEGTL